MIWKRKKILMQNPQKQNSTTLNRTLGWKTNLYRSPIKLKNLKINGLSINLTLRALMMWVRKVKKKKKRIKDHHREERSGILRLNYQTSLKWICQFKWSQIVWLTRYSSMKATQNMWSTFNPWSLPLELWSTVLEMVVTTIQLNYILTVVNNWFTTMALER